MSTVPNPIPSPLDSVDYYVGRLRRYNDRRDRRSAFVAMTEVLAGDQWATAEVTVARLRLAVEALRHVEADER